MLRSFTELSKIDSFVDRYNYLRLKGSVGESTFGFERYVNQRFYTSKEWRTLRNHIVARDECCDLGVLDREINERVIIHHMNPVKMEDFESGNADILDPEFLISTTHNTHNAIHYGDESLLIMPFVEREQGDTNLWSRASKEPRYVR